MEPSRKTLTNSNVVVTILPLFQSTVGLSFSSQRLQQTTKTTKSLTRVIGALKYKTYYKHVLGTRITTVSARA